MEESSLQTIHIAICTAVKYKFRISLGFSGRNSGKEALKGSWVLMVKREGGGEE